VLKVELDQAGAVEKWNWINWGQVGENGWRNAEGWGGFVKMPSHIVVSDEKIDLGWGIGGW